MQLKRTEAIVIRNVALNNGDMIVTVFTPLGGKVSLIAKNAKRSKKRFAGSIDLISKVNLEYCEKSFSALHQISFIDLLDHYSKIKENYDKIMIATYFLDLINSFHPENMSVPNSYKLLSMFLTYLNTDAPHGEILEAFQIKILCSAGFKLKVNVCTICRINIFEINEDNFSFRFNEIYCSKCRKTNTYRVKKATLKFVDKISMTPIKDFLGMSACDEIKYDLRNYVDHHLDLHLGKRLKSRDMVI